MLLFLGLNCMMVVLRLSFMVTFDQRDDTMASLFFLFEDGLYNLRFLWYCAATRLVPNI